MYKVVCSEQRKVLTYWKVAFTIDKAGQLLGFFFRRFPACTQSLDQGLCHKPVACDIIHYYSLPLWQETEQRTKNSHITDQEGVKVINQESVDSREKCQGDHSRPVSETILEQGRGLRSPQHMRPPVITRQVKYFGHMATPFSFSFCLITLTFTYPGKREWAGQLRHLGVHHHHHHHHPAQNNRNISPPVTSLLL